MTNKCIGYLFIKVFKALEKGFDVKIFLLTTLLPFFHQRKNVALIEGKVITPHTLIIYNVTFLSWSRTMLWSIVIFLLSLSNASNLYKCLVEGCAFIQRACKLPLPNSCGLLTSKSNLSLQNHISRDFSCIDQLDIRDSFMECEQMKFIFQENV